MAQKRTYAIVGLLMAALRRIASDPAGPATIEPSELIAGLRSLHIRHSRSQSREAPAADPVHVIFYRPTHANLVEILRVLHERMEPSRHVGEIE